MSDANTPSLNDSRQQEDEYVVTSSLDALEQVCFYNDCATEIYRVYMGN